MLAGSYVLLRMVAWLVSGLGGITLLLVMVGLYGVLSQFVARRVRELGLRLALGASVGGNLRLVLFEGIRPVFEGVAIGVSAALIGYFAVVAILGLSVTFAHFTVFVPVVVSFSIAAFLACYVPARRAARVEPSVALRDL
jgi:putative ABC transport system permease protein